VRLTKKGVPDKRSLSSRQNAVKAREAKLKKLAQKRDIIDTNFEDVAEIDEQDESSESESSEESEDDEIKELREQLAKRVKTKKLMKTFKSEEQEVKAPQNVSLDDLADTVAKTVTKTLKVTAEEKKAIAKAKREATKKAKAEGTYVPKPRGRPPKSQKDQTGGRTSTKTEPVVADYVQKVTGEVVSKSEILAEKPEKKMETPSKAFISW